MGIVRRTKSLNLILKSFEKTEGALSVVELIEEHKPQMNKTTVYRVLDRLEDEGILHSFTGKEGLKWYAKCHSCTSHHHVDTHPHFQCNTCGKTECLEDTVPVPNVPNFKVQKVEFLVYGECEDCQQ
jgi:Fur family ferric uptake transcriptional regulator